MTPITRRVERPSLDLLPARMTDDEHGAPRAQRSMLGVSRLASAPRTARPLL